MPGGWCFGSAPYSQQPRREQRPSVRVVALLPIYPEKNNGGGLVAAGGRLAVPHPPPAILPMTAPAREAASGVSLRHRPPRVAP